MLVGPFANLRNAGNGFKISHLPRVMVYHARVARQCDMIEDSARKGAIGCEVEYQQLILDIKLPLCRRHESAFHLLGPAPPADAAERRRAQTVLEAVKQLEAWFEKSERPPLEWLWELKMRLQLGTTMPRGRRCRDCPMCSWRGCCIIRSLLGRGSLDGACEVGVLGYGYLDARGSVTHRGGLNRLVYGSSSRTIGVQREGTLAGWARIWWSSRLALLGGRPHGLGITSFGWHSSKAFIDLGIQNHVLDFRCACVTSAGLLREQPRTPSVWSPLNLSMHQSRSLGTLAEDTPPNPIRGATKV